jgi:ferredoxin
MFKLAACVSGVVARGGRRAAVVRRGFLSSVPARSAVNLTFFEEASQESVSVAAQAGQTVLDVAMEHKIDIEGACGGELACSTCHVILPQEFFDKLPPKSEEEEDMLDLAWGVTDLSRLGCQLKVSSDLEGMRIVVPNEQNSML